MIKSKNSIQSAFIEATIIRADGTRVPLGVVAKYKRSIFKKIIDKFRR